MAVTQQRTARNFAHQMRWLVDQAYTDVPVVRLVLDNLNTHVPASLYETVAAPEAVASPSEFSSTTRSRTAVG